MNNVDRTLEAIKDARERIPGHLVGREISLLTVMDILNDAENDLRTLVAERDALAQRVELLRDRVASFDDMAFR
jgi:hypothetical protein